MLYHRTKHLNGYFSSFSSLKEDLLLKQSSPKSHHMHEKDVCPVRFVLALGILCSQLRRSMFVRKRTMQACKRKIQNKNSLCFVLSVQLCGFSH